MGKCADLGIPEHLHQNGRTAENENFTPDERMFRRFRPKDSLSEIVKTNFDFKSMSFNRERYSNPEDVLYNIKENNHYNDCGVASLTVYEIERIQIPHPDDKQLYTFKAVHDPEECMYPHSIVQVFKNGNKVSEIKPSSVKSLIRDEYEKSIMIIRMPDGHSL